MHVRGKRLEDDSASDFLERVESEEEKEKDNELTF